MELQREGESHLKEKKALLHEIQTIKDTMASEKAAMSKAHKVNKVLINTRTVHSSLEGI